MKKDDFQIAVIGLGYVGLPLAVLLDNHFKVLGYDYSDQRIVELKEGHDKTLEVTSVELKSSRVGFTSSVNEIEQANFYIITVPTPVFEDRSPDLSFVESATRAVGKILKKGDIVVYESTVYPGCTEEFCVPLLEEESSLEYNQDFFCGYSPERVNPGDKKHTIDKIVKVVAGSNKETLEKVDFVYSHIITAGTHRTSSIKAAEAAKVIENAQRDINIAFVNELSMIFNKMNIDTTEVLEAAGTKWNFLHFRPGLVGGHCIGVDPYYLAHKSEELGHHPDVILSGRKINDTIPYFIADEVEKKLQGQKNQKVAILGLTFKENCPDLRNSKVFDIIKGLEKKGINPIVHDPYHNDCQNLNFQKFDEIEDCSVIVLAVGHQYYQDQGLEKIQRKIREDGSLFDLKSVFKLKDLEASGRNFWRL